MHVLVNYLVQCLALFGVIRQRLSSPFYLREKDPEFLIDIRLWLEEETIRNRRCVALATTRWSGAEGKGLRVRQIRDEH